MEADDRQAPRAATVRLDDETRALVQAYMTRNDVTFSSAVRVLVALGASKVETLEADFVRATIREGVIAGAGAIKERLEGAIRSAFGDLDKLGS